MPKPWEIDWGQTQAVAPQSDPNVIAPDPARVAERNAEEARKNEQLRLAREASERAAASDARAAGSDARSAADFQRRQGDDQRKDQEFAATHDGSGVPMKPISDSSASSIQENLKTLRAINVALQKLDPDQGGRPDSIGPGTGMLGDTFTQWHDPEGTGTRAAIGAVGAYKIHDLSGAAVSATEAPRFQPFVPTITDRPEVAKEKLNQFRSALTDQLREQINFFSPQNGYRPYRTQDIDQFLTATDPKTQPGAQQPDQQQASPPSATAGPGGGVAGGSSGPAPTSPGSGWTAQQAAQFWGEDVYDQAGHPLDRNGGAAYDRSGNYMGIFGGVSDGDAQSPLPTSLIAQGKGEIEAATHGTPSADAQKIVADTKAFRGMEGDQTGIGGVGTLITNGITGGLYDEASGVGTGTAALLTGQNPVQGYLNGRNAAREAVDDARAAHPNIGGAAEILGSLAGAGLPAGVEAAAPSITDIAKGAAAYGGVTGFGEGNGLTDSVERGVTGAVVGGATGAAIGTAGTKLAESKLGQLIATRRAASQAAEADAAAASRAAPTPDMRVVQAGAEESIPIRQADARPALRGKLGATEATQNGGPIIRDTAANDTAAIENRVSDIGGAGNPGDRHIIGSTVQEALARHGEYTSKQGGALYDRAAKASGDVKVEPTNAITAVDDQIAKLQESGPKANAGEISYLEDLKSDLSRPGGLSIQAIRDQRTGMRGQIAARNLDKTQAEHRVGLVLDAASQDIKAALADNPKALGAYQTADDFWRQRSDFRKQVTQRLLGPANNPYSPEQTARTIESMMKGGGDYNRFKRMTEVLSPEEKVDLAASVASNIGRNGRGDFSLPFLLKSLDPKTGINQRTAKLVFGEDGAKSLANLRVIADAKVAAMSERNTSKTGNAMGKAVGGLKSMIVTGLGLAQGGVAGGIVAGAAENFISRWGQERAARALMNPDFTRWIKMAPETTDPVRVNQYISKLTAVAANSPTAANDIAAFRGVLMDAFGASPAPRIAAQGQQDKDVRREEPGRPSP